MDKSQSEQLLDLILTKVKRVDHFAVRQYVSEYLRKKDSPEDNFEMYLDHMGGLGHFFENNVQGHLQKRNNKFEICLTEEEYFCGKMETCKIKHELNDECYPWCFKPILNECGLEIKFDSIRQFWIIFSP